MTMSAKDDLLKFKEELKLKMQTIEDVARMLEDLTEDFEIADDLMEVLMEAKDKLYEIL